MEITTSKPSPNDVTPSGIKVYQARTIDLTGLANFLFIDCVFVDVIFIGDATAQIKKDNSFAGSYQVSAMGEDQKFEVAESSLAIQNAVRFERCYFIGSKVRTTKVIGELEVLNDLTQGRFNQR